MHTVLQMTPLVLPARHCVPAAVFPSLPLHELFRRQYICVSDFSGGIDAYSQTLLLLRTIARRSTAPSTVTTALTWSVADLPRFVRPALT